ncbi:hypothetical protein DFQ27_003139 [Actinomortierella ambigua]|uniref:Uncharacterized protein n=1 Tax=Actinomortierella ambigua TaxID=1343610 RepID=A0A9P6Q5N8_9FUNG|nr:hypothetical protein DFQ27_003139 [Actinomortierella ambigua]
MAATQEKRDLDLENLSLSSRQINEKHIPGEDPGAPIPEFPGSEKNEDIQDIKGEILDAGSLDDEEDLEESIRLVPKIVRELVSMEDDPNTPTVTFRSAALARSVALDAANWMTTGSSSMFVENSLSREYWLAAKTLARIMGV